MSTAPLFTGCVNAGCYFLSQAHSRHLDGPTEFSCGRCNLRFTVEPPPPVEAECCHCACEICCHCGEEVPF